jgi:hypothetical protein
MKQNDSAYSQVDEDKIMKSQMEQMVNSYDSYMRTMTLGRECALREMTVNLAQVKPGDCVLALPTQPLPRVIAQALFGGMLQHDLQELLPLIETSGFSDVEIAQAKFRVLGLSVLAFVRAQVRGRVEPFAA